MLESEIQEIADMAVGKYELSKNHVGKYFISSIMAGVFIVIAIILSSVTSAVFYQEAPYAGKLISALLFSIAIILIVFFGTDLFTGNSMTMAIGLYQGKCTGMQLLRVLIISYIGNFIGCLVFGFVYAKSGASVSAVGEYMSTYLMNKLELSSMELLLRGILCNFCVCLAVLSGIRLKTEAGKLIVMVCVIATFVMAGFEHCVANMGIFSLSYMILSETPPIGLVLHNLFFVTIGNVIGGAVMLAAPIIYTTKQAR